MRLYLVLPGSLSCRAGRCSSPVIGCSHEQAVADSVPILAEPFDGPFGRTFSMADPDGYRITVYEKDQPLFWPPRRG